VPPLIRSLKLLFVEERGMVSGTLVRRVRSRLQQIFPHHTFI
jgi:hypothetical protein